MKNLMLCDLIGSHQFLSAYPIIVYVLIYFFFYLFLLIGRWISEGRAYDVAYSSKFGDIALAAFVIIAARIIQQPYFHPASWMESKTFHFIVAGISIKAAVVYLLTSKPRYAMDRWHALFVVPVFFYLIATTLPVYYQYASLTQFINGIFCILIWLVLVIYDGKKDRLDQRKWIRKHHPEWKFKN